MSPQRTILVDGNALLYRMFYALPPLQTSSGEYTNALLGFARALRQVRVAKAPDQWLVTFDGGSDRRKAIFSDYKAQRPAMPVELSIQVPVIEEYLDTAGIAWLRVPGEEADDVIATVATALSSEGGEVLVMTSDKDLMQIVTDSVRLFNLKDLRRETGRQEVFNKAGVWPESIVEWLALVGDNSDNIPGVPGVGAKTAAKLLGQYGSIKGLLEALDEVKPERIRASIAECRQVLQLNVELVQLHRNLACCEEIRPSATSPESLEMLRGFLDRWELKSLVRTLEIEQDRGEISP